jgi:hypothetical protein
MKATEVVKEAMEVLGCEMGAIGKKMTPKDKKKIEKTNKTAQLIGALPIGHRMKTIAIKSMALAKITYGWVARELPVTEAKGTFNKTLKALNAAWARKANPHLKASLVGGTMHLKSIIAQRIIGMAQTMRWRTSRILSWNDNQGGFVHMLRKSMKSLMWQEQEPFRWVHEQNGAYTGEPMRIHLTAQKPLETTEEKQHRKLLCHNIRESWRILNWSNWLKAKGRIPEQIREAQAAGQTITYDSERFTKVRKRFEADDGTARAILSGAVMSPACLGDPCIWPGCTETLGTWKHVCWTCTHRPSDMKMPLDALEQRLGWAPVKGKSSNWATLLWLKEATKAIWDHRYDNETKQRLKKLKMDSLNKENKETEWAETQVGCEDDSSDSEEEVASGDET